MNVEDRLRTFGNWPLAYISPLSLAEAGYIYTGEGDEVKCVTCNCVHFDWAMGDKPIFEHRRDNPECPYAAMVADGDVYIPAMVNYRDRFGTFAEWPVYAQQRPRDLAMAGFYFMEVADRVQCFCCGRKLEKWTPDDDPWIEHAIHEPRCEFLIEKQGLEFVYYVQRFHDMDHRKWVTGPRTDRRDFLTAHAVELGCHYTYLIKALLRNKTAWLYFDLKDLVEAANRIKERITVARLDGNSQVDKECSFPCGHAVCCTGCSERLRECPVCRQLIFEKVKLFFA
ncbi:putative inhibitor of apoptosis [Paramacrobiotus metropolitanus]|uniref:putative inhibitor of apoptosis n=1 Tax=Paramacrobiotus metropolitanus TaxID=2943436 RepID=UPI0024465A72|nr:putative inhibitor of apoptosis [Paramacrobiotus metropolitanus]